MAHSPLVNIGSTRGSATYLLDVLLQIAQDRTLGTDDEKSSSRAVTGSASRESSGRLDPDIVQRRVRTAYGLFRMCYESGLHGGPNLEGRITLRFQIGSDGLVKSVDASDSDIHDSAVVDCVVRQTYLLEFPPPEGGTVTVVYPIMFSPG